MPPLRQILFPPHRPVGGALIASLIAIQLLFLVFWSMPWARWTYAQLHLDPGSVVRHGEIWRLWTYAFLHDVSGPWHILFNCLVLLQFGEELEMLWGSRQFLGFYFFAGLGAGVFVCVSYLLGLSDWPVVGASGAILGLVAAFCLTFPSRRFYFFGLVSVRAVHLLGLMPVFEIVHLLLWPNVAVAAHVGGTLTGAFMTLRLWRVNAWRRLPSEARALWRIAHE